MYLNTIVQNILFFSLYLMCHVRASMFFYLFTDLRKTGNTNFIILPKDWLF